MTISFAMKNGISVSSGKLLPPCWRLMPILKSTGLPIPRRGTIWLILSLFRTIRKYTYYARTLITARSRQSFPLLSFPTAGPLLRRQWEFENRFTCRIRTYSATMMRFTVFLKRHRQVRYCCIKPWNSRGGGREFAPLLKTSQALTAPFSNTRVVGG